MNIHFTEHSLLQIAARKVSMDEVAAIINNPEQIVPDEENPLREIYQSHFVDNKGKLKLLRVVVEVNKDEVLVVTAYPTSQISKYWKE
jgi:F0F1-type ATP synthase delta subunit